METQEILLTLLRILIGLLFVGHGAQKLFGWFGGPGLAGATQFTDSLGIRPARLWAVVNSLSEFIGGLFLILGFLTPVAAALIVGIMLTAIVKVHAANGLWNTGGGYEFNLLIIANAFLLGMSPPTPASVDYGMNYGWTHAQMFIVSLVVVIIGLFITAYVSSLPAPARSTETTQPR